MRVLFAGTPGFAATALRALIQAGHEIVAVLTQPDRAAERGLRPVPSEVKLLARNSRLPIMQPESLKSEEVVAALSRVRADVMVVAAYGVIIPATVLDLASLGGINIHASLLPRWRGAAPIPRALLAGDGETGISIMKMNEGLDTGPVLIQKSVAIEDEDTAQTLHDKLAALGAEMIVEALPRYAQGELQPSPQPEVGVTYARKIEKREALVVWDKSGAEVSRQIRAFNPSPGAFSQLSGQPVKLWMATSQEEITGAPGEIASVGPKGVGVACARGGIFITEMQRPGGRRQPAAAFARGLRLAPGMHFG
ncbi:MAG: methionyl-tRNA formyltransferase [Burkholderiales bacterium]